MSKPTTKQRKMAGFVLAHPEWSLARCARESGYSEAEYRHHIDDVFGRKGLQTAMAELKPRYIGRLQEHFTPETAADRMIALATQDDQPGAALNAVRQILQDMGVVEEKDRQQIMLVCMNACADAFGGIVLECLPDDRKSDFARRLTEISGTSSAAHGEPHSGSNGSNGNGSKA